MNERIKLLATQADNYADSLGLGGGDWCDAQLQKFAELIVQESAEFIAPLGDWCGGYGQRRAPSTKECAAKLKQHFGVE